MLIPHVEAARLHVLRVEPASLRHVTHAEMRDALGLVPGILSAFVRHVRAIKHHEIDVRASWSWLTHTSPSFVVMVRSALPPLRLWIASTRISGPQVKRSGPFSMLFVMTVNSLSARG
jgi:hypothetical protein